jgi:hypothetical protein
MKEVTGELEGLGSSRSQPHDGVCVNDSVVCCEYLADISPPGACNASAAASPAAVSFG